METACHGQSAAAGPETPPHYAMDNPKPDACNFLIYAIGPST